MSAGITEAGSRLMAHAAVGSPAEMALYYRDEMVAGWFAYDLDENTPHVATTLLAVDEVRVRSIADHTSEVRRRLDHTVTLIGGWSFVPPPCTTWFQTVDQ